MFVEAANVTSNIHSIAHIQYILNELYLRT